MQMYQPLIGEIEISVVRRFPLFVALVLWRLIKRIAIPFFIGALMFYLFDNDMLEHLDVFFGFFFLYVCVLILFAFIEWINEELDILVLTNKRIIIFIQKTLFKRQSSIATLDQIQDVKGIQNGMIEHFLGIGTVEIQTAAGKVQFQIQEVRNPENVVAAINKAIHDSKENLEEVRKDEKEGVYANEFLNSLLQGNRKRITSVVSS